MECLLKYVQKKYIENKDFPAFNAGDTITVYYEIKEGDKTRTQSFRGVVIQRRGQDATATFTVRKMSGDIGVERIFVLSQSSIQKIEVNKHGKVRKSRIYYFRKLRGKKARIKEKQY
ncbi:MAG: 50S ribosomal protein L19 [Flavobacteriales bacterium]